VEIVKPVSINLGGKERRLKLTLGGMKAYFDATGKSILKGEVDFHNMTEKETIAFIWSCLIWEDRKLTLEDVGFLLDFQRIDEITDKLIETALASFPEKKDEPKNA
jgi:hypothetical protein